MRSFPRSPASAACLVALLLGGTLRLDLARAQSPEAKPALSPAPVQKAGSTDYSKEAFVIESYGKEVLFSEDGTSRTIESATIRVQSEAAVRQFGVLAFPFNKDGEEVQIESVTVRKPDGTIVATPSTNAQEVSSAITKIAPTYTDYREKQVPIRALSVGDVLSYKTIDIRKRPDVPGQFWLSENFLSGSVVLQQFLKISVPRNKYVNVVSPKLKPDVQEDATSRTYSWTSSLLLTSKEREAEAKRKDTRTTTQPDVQISTFRNWEEIGKWYRGLQSDRLAITPTIRAKALELTAGLTSTEDKQRAIYNYVSTRFRYLEVALGIGRFQPHAAEEVLSNQYGDCKDKHTLFATLLKAAGIEAWPVLIGSGLKLDEKVPTPAAFNHVITMVPGTGKQGVWLDTTPEVAPYGMLMSQLRDEQALVIPSEGNPYLMKTPATPSFPLHQDVSAKAVLSDSGTLKGHFDVTMRDDSEVALRAIFRQVPPADWEAFVQRFSESLGFGGTVSNVEVDSPESLDKPFHFAYDYERKNYSDWDSRRLTPPLYPLILQAPDREKKLSEPFPIGAPETLNYRVEMELPKGYTAKVPDDAHLDNEFARYESHYKLAGNELTAERIFSVKKTEVPVTSADDYREFVEDTMSDTAKPTQLLSSGKHAPTPATASDPEAAKLVEKAAHAVEWHDLAGARKLLSQAEELNANEINIWSVRGAIEMADGHEEAGLAALRQEVAAHPENTDAHLAIAKAEIIRSDDPCHAIGSKESLVTPDASKMGPLAELLVTKGCYNDALDVIGMALAAHPRDGMLNGIAASALLHTGKQEEGIAAIKKGLAVRAGAAELNNAAYALADTNTNLELAKEYAERAIGLAEEDTKNIALAGLTNGDLRHVAALPSIWDTAGWVYFRAGDYAKAQTFLTAAWQLGQEAAHAEHLGDLYRAQGRMQNAIYYWQLSLASDSKRGSVQKKLQENKRSGNPVLIPVANRKGAEPILNPGQELGRSRTFDIPLLPKQTGTAEFFLLFRGGKLQESRFISGDEKLKSASEDLTGTKFPEQQPDSGPETVVRRGILSCSHYTKPSCQFVLLRPVDTRL